MPSIEFRKLLEALSQAGAEFIVVGGCAAVLQNVPISTFDLDIVHRRTPENIDRLLSVLATLDAHFYPDFARRNRLTYVQCVLYLFFMAMLNHPLGSKPLTEIDLELLTQADDLELLSTQTPEFDLELLSAQTPEFDLELLSAQTPEFDLELLSAQTPEFDLELLSAQTPEFDLKLLSAQTPEFDSILRLDI